ncbi:metal-dependent hydrolase [Candidatus Woesearchaeota archaeon]|nr:metal-dependent hydrolase [Candidatus Woesearchaeota archaeon]
MLFRTHALFALLIGTLIYQYFSFNPYFFVFLVFVGAVIPDIDKGTSKINNFLKITKPIAFVTRHRGIFHSLFFAVLISVLVHLYNHVAGIALFIGYMSHVLLDGLNHAGVNLIHPLQKLHISGFIETGSWGEHILTVFLGVVFLLRLRVLLF